MSRYVDAFFRHKIIAILPIVIALVVAVGYEMRQPPQYQSTASIWIDAPIPNDSTILAGPQPGPSTAAQGVLEELLHTKQFVDAVVKEDPAATFISSSKKVSVGTPGPQIMTVATTGDSAQVAARADQAIVDAFVKDLSDNASARATELRAYYGSQVQTAASALSQAQQRLSQYLAAHPAAAGLTTADPTAAQLSSAVAAAQQQYGDAETNYSKAGLGLTAGASQSELHVIDRASLPPAPKSVKKKLILFGVGGLLAGLMITSLVLAGIIAASPTPLTPEQVERELGLRVVATLDGTDNRRRHRSVS